MSKKEAVEWLEDGAMYKGSKTFALPERSRFELVCNGELHLYRVEDQNGCLNRVGVVRPRDISGRIFRFVSPGAIYSVVCGSTTEWSVSVLHREQLQEHPDPTPVEITVDETAEERDLEITQRLRAMIRQELKGIREPVGSVGSMSVQEALANDFDFEDEPEDEPQSIYQEMVPEVLDEPMEEDRSSDQGDSASAVARPPGGGAPEGVVEPEGGEPPDAGADKPSIGGSEGSD